MSATTTEAVLEESPPAETGRRRRRLLVGAACLALALAVVGWWFLGRADAGEPPTEVDGEIVALEPLTTTVGQEGRNHARVALAVVLTEGTATDIVEPRVPLLKDALLRELAAVDADQLRSAEGSDRLRERLSAEGREIWGEDAVRRVVLTELMVQ